MSGLVFNDYQKHTHQSFIQLDIPSIPEWEPVKQRRLRKLKVTQKIPSPTVMNLMKTPKVKQMKKSIHSNLLIFQPHRRGKTIPHLLTIHLMKKSQQN